MHFVYLIRSISRTNKTYVGMTEDVESRLKAHNEGLCPWLTTTIFTHRRQL